MRNGTPSTELSQFPWTIPPDNIGRFLTERGRKIVTFPLLPYFCVNCIVQFFLFICTPKRNCPRAPLSHILFSVYCAAKTETRKRVTTTLLLRYRNKEETFSKKHHCRWVHLLEHDLVHRSNTEICGRKLMKNFTSRVNNRGPITRLEISSANWTRRKSENGELRVKVGLERRGLGEREGREQNASGNAIVWRQAFPRWPMVAALKADGAPETSSKKKDKESRNDGKEIHAAGRDRPRKGRKTFALGES